MAWFNFFKKSKNKPSDTERSDYFEASAWSDYDYKIFDKDIELDYTDMNGQQTVRKFSVQKYFFADDLSEWFVQGYCHLRAGNRTFRVSRINSVTDLDTGEFLTAGISDYFQEVYQSSDFYCYERVCEDFEDEIRVLLYLSRLDGRFTQKEKDIIVDFVLKGSNGNKEPVRQFFLKERLKYGDTEITQNQALKSARNIKKRGPDRVASLGQAITEISNSVKTQNPVAQAGVQFIRDKLDL